MSKSLKLMMVALCTLFMAGQANAVQYLDEAHSGIHKLNDNQHVFTFIPRDIKGIQGNTTRAIYKCAEDGTEVIYDQQRNRIVGSKKHFGVCATYYSRSTDTSWVIAFVSNGMKMRAVRILKIENDQSKLWATFDQMNRDRNTYASTGAQKFAGINGNRNSDVAQSPDEQGNNDVAQAPQPEKKDCSGKSFFEKAACEFSNAGIENIGTIINKGR